MLPVVGPDGAVVGFYKNAGTGPFEPGETLTFTRKVRAEKKPEDALAPVVLARQHVVHNGLQYEFCLRAICHLPPDSWFWEIEGMVRV
jgi:hypothetical protein